MNSSTFVNVLQCRVSLLPINISFTIPREVKVSKESENKLNHTSEDKLYKDVDPHQWWYYMSPPVIRTVDGYCTPCYLAMTVRSEASCREEWPGY